MPCGHLPASFLKPGFLEARNQGANAPPGSARPPPRAGAFATPPAELLWKTLHHKAPRTSRAAPTLRSGAALSCAKAVWPSGSHESRPHPPNEKAAPGFPSAAQSCLLKRHSALTGLVALLRLVDHIDAAFTAHDLAIAMTLLERAERVCNLHRCSPCRGAVRLFKTTCPCRNIRRRRVMVGATGIEPVTPTMST